MLSNQNIIMHSLQNIRDIRNLHLMLFGGLTPEEFYKQRGIGALRPTETGREEITGYVEFDLETGEIRSYDSPPER